MRRPKTHMHIVVNIDTFITINYKGATSLFKIQVMCIFNLLLLKMCNWNVHDSIVLIGE